METKGTIKDNVLIIEIPEGIEEIIEDREFTNKTELPYGAKEIEVKLPTSLQKIGENAFKGYNMHNITIPYECEIIDPTAFADCNNVIVYNKSNLWLEHIFQGENSKLLIIDQFDLADEKENVDFNSNYVRLNYYIGKTDDIEEISEHITEKLNEIYYEYADCDDIQDIQIIIDEDIYSTEYAEKIRNNIANNLIELKDFEKLDNVAVCKTNIKYQIIDTINEITSDEIAPVLHNNSIRICQHHNNYVNYCNEHYIVDYVNSMQDLINYPNYIYENKQTLNFTKYGNVEENKDDFSKLLKTIYNGIDKDYHIHALGFSNFDYNKTEFCNLFNEFSTDEYPYKKFVNVYYNDCELAYKPSKDTVNDKTIIVPDDVKYIKKSTFYNYDNLESVKLPYGLKNIGRFAFQECASLKNIKIPDTVNCIEASAFCNCTSLTNIKLPNIKRIEYDTFNHCTKLRNIEFPSGLERIDMYAFHNCTSLTDIKLPNSLESIGRCAFAYCDSLEKIVIPSSVKEIEDYAFANCHSLKEVVIPKDTKLKSI